MNKNTLQSVIDKTDELCPNQYSTEQKAAWLGELDGKIHREVLLHYCCHRPDCFDGYDHADPDTPLLVGFPYGEPMYVWWLQMQIAVQNAEIPKYNSANEMFNIKYREWLEWFSSNHQRIGADRFIF